MKTNSAMQDEQNDNAKLALAAKELEYARSKETEARKALASAIETAKIVRQKYDELFAKNEARAVARRKAGLIEVNPGY